MNERLRRFGRLGGRAFGVLLLGFLIVATVGYAVGPEPGIQSAPTVDTDGPPSEVVADAATQLRVRDHTYELWQVERNRTTGSVNGGILWRMRIQHSRDRIRSVVWDGHSRSNDTVEPTERPEREGFSNRYTVWVNDTDDAKGWHRYESRIEPLYQPTTASPVRYPSELRNVSMETVAENETTLIVRTSNEQALEALHFGGSRGNVTITFVVAKTDDPYLSRVTVREEMNDRVDVTTLRVSAVGTTTAKRPDPLPPTTPVEVFRRSAMGVASLLR